MPLDTTTITSYAQPLYQGSQVYLSWTSSISGPTVWFQLYLGGVLSWFGQTTSVWLPAPSAVEPWIVGTVPAGEQQISFASSLPPAPDRQVLLTWLGGTFESTDIAGFKIYGEPTPGGGISYSAPLSTITAYPAGIVMDGYGLGGYGLGGYGEAASTYTWTSANLTSGTWHFAVVPFDGAGNNGTGTTIAQTIAVPPLAPPIGPAGLRLNYTYSSSTHEATLTWLASTG